jgi:hypothetical protein
MTSLVDLTDVEGALVSGVPNPQVAIGLAVLSPHSHVFANNNSFTMECDSFRLICSGVGIDLTPLPNCGGSHPAAQEGRP